MKLSFIDKPTHLFRALLEKVVMTFDIKNDNKDAFGKMDNDTSANKDKEIDKLKKTIFKLNDDMDILINEYKSLQHSIGINVLQNEINNIKTFLYENNNKIYSDFNTRIDTLTNNILATPVTTPVGPGTHTIQPTPPAISLITSPIDGGVCTNDISTFFEKNGISTGPVSNPNDLLKINQINTLISDGILDELKSDIMKKHSDIHKELETTLSRPNPVDLAMSSSIKNIYSEYIDTFEV